MRAKALIISCFLVIALIATPIAGCVGNQSPIASFSYTPAAPTTGTVVSFSDSSSDSDGSLISWLWDFGDGGTSSAQNPTHTYLAVGTFVVTLTVIDDGGASDTESVNITVTAAPPGLGAWDAIEILVKQIIPPAASDQPVSAAMLSQPLLAGDVVTSGSGASYNITTKTWFIFIDDNPQAFYAHPTRYVFMDAQTGSYNIVNESWPPDVNGYSMWNPQLGKGHLLELWSVLDTPMPITPVASSAPEADYGDAPDGQAAYYGGVLGRFPTLFATTNSHFGLPGGHTLNVGEETLGLNVSAEVDALDPFDPDGMPNLVDADKDERIYVITELNQARLAFTVSVSLGAPDITRYANALIDFDYSGHWSESSYGVEWVTVNLDVNVDPGDSETILTPLFAWSSVVSPAAVWSSGVWMRLALTRSQVDASLYAGVGGWEGAGQFSHGEIEDHFVFLTDMPPQPEFADYWPPPPPNGNGNGNGNGGGGGGPGGGPEDGPCGYDINYLVLVINCGDKYEHIAKGTPIAQEASSSVADVTQGQGYVSAGNLGPGNNSPSQIGQAIADLAAEAKCGDHVLIYICGHGGQKNADQPEGGIHIYDSSGNDTGELLTPSALAGFLGGFEACDGEECGTPGCCHVSVIIESCYAGNFNVPGLNDQEIIFRLEVENDGVCRDVVDLMIVDLMDICLEYAGDAMLYVNGVLVGYLPPDSIVALAEGAELTWDLSDVISSFHPGDVISIEYSAYTVLPGVNLNEVAGSGHCSYNYNNIVTDQDYVMVWVVVEEEVLYGDLYVEYYCQCDELFCLFCDVYAEFYAEDTSLLLGPYPVTNVVLYVDGWPVFDSGSISEPYYSWFYEIPDAACNTTYEFTMIATNSIGLTVTVTKYITTPLFCD